MAAHPTPEKDWLKSLFLMSSGDTEVQTLHGGQMLSTKFKFISIHVPKTGGNFLNRALLPMCDNEIYCEKFHDGVNQFGVRGAYSEDKHAPLSVYAQHLGEAFKTYRIIMSVRHPFPRALSFFFSPHRWFRKQPDGIWLLHDPVWNEASFLKLIHTGGLLSAMSFLNLDPRPKPDFLIRTENLAEDLNHVVRKLGLPRDLQVAPQRINTTAVKTDVLTKLLQSVDLRDQVEAAFSEDMIGFGYDSYIYRG